MARKKLRVGLIGCGVNMTRAHVPRAVADGAVGLAAVADPDPAAARRLMAAWGGDVAYHADWAKLLERDDLDAVIISTPHEGHYRQVKAALQSGRHVLVEKPLTIQGRHARELLALAERRDLLLVVSYQRHHMAPFAYARELVQRGRLGRLGGVVGYVTQGTAGRVDWRLDPARAGGGMFADTGSHLVAAALWVTGLAPRAVTAHVDRNGGPVDVNTLVQVQFAGGALGSLSTFGAAGRHDERLAISGSGGSLVIHLHEWRFRSLLLDDEPARVPQRLRDETPDAAFFRWIRNGGRGYEPPRTAYQAVRLTEAAYRAAAERRPVRMR